MPPVRPSPAKQQEMFVEEVRSRLMEIHRAVKARPMPHYAQQAIITKPSNRTTVSATHLW
jgi:hypothetical protein